MRQEDQLEALRECEIGGMDVSAMGLPNGRDGTEHVLTEDAKRASTHASRRHSSRCHWSTSGIHCPDTVKNHKDLIIAPQSGLTPRLSCGARAQPRFRHRPSARRQLQPVVSWRHRCTRSNVPLQTSQSHLIVAIPKTSGTRAVPAATTIASTKKSHNRFRSAKTRQERRRPIGMMTSGPIRLTYAE
jgi:hypothetical protein